MTVGARLRSKAASSLPRCGPLARGRGRTERDEEAAAILEHLESGAEAAESEASAPRPGSRGARRVHLAVLPERYEPLEEQVPSEKPKKRYRKKLKKYGKNVGKVIAKGCRYIVIGLQGFSAAYSAPFGVATSVVSFVR
ncbi:required for drug-induced death protein 1 [Moschus berezovskii]|uniref:Chromosome 1 open reading frame 115 n=1 Tax=Moschus moschiferus TaxID=68415 RepID=A0A8C6FTN5_MOSMO|nr:required for drug-induced death protein 1 [Moschus berezovskii]